MNSSFSKQLPSRRRFLQLGLTGTAVGLLTSGLEFAVPLPALAQSILTPDAALTELMEGNKRFIAGKLTAHDHDLAILKQHTAEKQEPFAAVLSCADSRVPVELVFDQSIGHLFVVRVAGNVATPDTIASLEYGAAVLGTKAILVLGHTNCGAVKATMAGEAVPGQISTLYQYIHPAIAGAKGDLTTVSRQNARLQASVLSETSPVLGELVKQKKLAIRAALYDVGSGKVTMIEA